MNANLKNIIQKSLVQISRGPKFLEESSIEIIDTRKTASSGSLDAGSSLILPLVSEIDQPFPLFDKLPSGQFKTPQETIMGYYVLRNIARGLFIGASFIPAGDILLKVGFLAPSVAMYYTATLHLMFAYLSLEGRVLITPVYGLPCVIIGENSTSSEHRPVPGSPQAICAILTDDSRWVFEGRKITHKAYWAELDRLLPQIKSVPRCFVEFARYLTFCDPSDRAKLSELEMVRAGLFYLQDARHEAIYKGYGLDPWSNDLLTNRDADYAPLDLRAKEYQSFAYGLLNHIVDETTAIITYLHDQDLDALADTRLDLAVAIRTPPFDLRKDLSSLLLSKKCDTNRFNDLLEQFLTWGKQDT